MDPWLLIWEGILYGLTLTILLGPIFVALTQTGIEKGITAGILVGSGIWISDIVIITVLTLLMGSFAPEKKPHTFDLELIGNSNEVIASFSENITTYQFHCESIGTSFQRELFLQFLV